MSFIFLVRALNDDAAVLDCPYWSPPFFLANGCISVLLTDTVCHAFILAFVQRPFLERALSKV